MKQKACINILKGDKSGSAPRKNRNASHCFMRKPPFLCKRGKNKKQNKKELSYLPEAIIINAIDLITCSPKGWISERSAEVMSDYMSRIAEKGQLVVLAGPNDGSKNQIAKAYMEDHPNAVRCTTVTTREKREDETDGVEHWFLSVTEFDRLVRTQQLLTYSYTNRNGYGTTRKAVEEARRAGHNVILVTDAFDALKIKTTHPEATIIFMLAPSWEVLESRLRAKNAKLSEEEIQDILEEAREEILCAGQFDYVLIHDVLEDTVRRLSQIVHGNRYSRNSMKGFVESYIESEISSEIVDMF